MTRLFVMCALVFSIALVTPAAPAGAVQDVSGLWTGTIDIEDHSSGTTITTPVRIELDQQSSAISGKIGRPEDHDNVPIKNAHREGNKIWFEASNGETEGPVKFALIIEGDSMEGDMKTALDNEMINGKVKVTRAKK